MARRIKDLSYYASMAEQATRGRIDDRAELIEIVNDAGETLINMHEWKFLERPTIDLDFIEGQEHVSLPKDFGRAITIEVPNSLQTTVEFTSLSDVQYLRGSALNDPFRFHVALVYPGQDDTQSHSADPRFEIWPEIATTELGALKLVYLAKWTRMEDFDSVPNIPRDVEPVFVELVRKMGLAYGDPTISVAETVETVERSSLVRSLKRRYGMAQMNLGISEGGIIPVDRTYIYRPHRSIFRAGNN